MVMKGDLADWPGATINWDRTGRPSGEVDRGAHPSRNGAMKVLGRGAKVDRGSLGSRELAGTTS